MYYSKDPVDSTLEKFKTELIQKLFEIVRATNPTESLDYRMLLPQDFGLPTNSRWTWNVNAGLNNFQFTVPNTTAIGVFGIFNRTGNAQVYEVDIRQGSNTTRVFQLEELYVRQEPLAYFDPFVKDPVIFSENMTVNLQMYAEAANNDERLGFLGFVVEPKRRINRDLKAVSPPKRVKK